jgi:Glycosyl-hydrolase family 116, catalytic region
MCTSVYCGALAAISAMAKHLGEEADASTYAKLAERSAEYLKKELFGGEFFIQKVMWNELQANIGFKEMLGKLKPGEHELVKILKTEGPRYQYGSGCISDGVIGAWMAQAYGVQTPQDRKLIRKHLKSVYRYNFREDLFRHACPQRPGYAMGHEGGLILCTWPKGNKPTIPFIYSDEVWTGIEYQVASHMIAEGMVEEGTRIVQAARDRYDGHTRNPYNEYECGNYYARAMASYALLGAYSGFRYSAVDRTLWLDPKTDRLPFRTFFSTAGAYGTIELTKKGLTVHVMEGELAVKQVEIMGKRSGWEVVVRAGETATMPLSVNAKRQTAKAK